MVVTIPPWLSVSEMIGIPKGKTAISIFKEKTEDIKMKTNNEKKANRRIIASFRGYDTSSHHLWWWSLTS